MGTVDHIVDLEVESADRSSYSPLWELPGEKLCDRSPRSPASEYIKLPDYAGWNDLEKTTFEGNAPTEICSYCWSNVIDTLEQAAQHADDGILDRIGTVGYQLR